MIKRIFLALTFMFFAVLAFAQNDVEMASVMRSNGKIYNVVAVCLTILLGLFFYLFTIDRKISRLEKDK